MVNETIEYKYDETNDVYVVEIQETGAERTIDGITVREVFEIFEEEVNDFSDEKMQDIEIIREMIDVVSNLLHMKQYIVELALMVYGVIPIIPKNNFKGDNMEINELYDSIEETVDKSLEQFKNTFLEIFDDETTSKGRIYINTNTDEDDVLPIVNKVLEQFPMVKVEIEEQPSITLGYYYYGFTISIVDIIKEENLNNYHKICNKEEKEKIIMDNVIFDNDFDDYGIEETNIIFEDEIEDEIGGDWYCRASGGAFSSSEDYWDYILG